MTEQPSKPQFSNPNGYKKRSRDNFEKKKLKETPLPVLNTVWLQAASSIQEEREPARATVDILQTLVLDTIRGIVRPTPPEPKPEPKPEPVQLAPIVSIPTHKKPPQQPVCQLTYIQVRKLWKRKESPPKNTQEIANILRSNGFIVVEITPGFVIVTKKQQNKIHNYLTNNTHLIQHFR